METILEQLERTIQLEREKTRQQERRADSERDRAEKAESVAKAQKVRADKLSRKNARAVAEKQERELTTFGQEYAKSCKDKTGHVQVRESSLDAIYSL